MMETINNNSSSAMKRARIEVVAGDESMIAMMDERCCCSICMEDYNEHVHVPKVLQCGHTFCLVCIAKLTGNNNYVRFQLNTYVHLCFILVVQLNM